MKEPKKELFNEIWFYYKKWLNNDDSEKQWEQIIKEGGEIIKKYDFDVFAKELVYLIQKELGRKE